MKTMPKLKLIKSDPFNCDGCFYNEDSKCSYVEINGELEGDKACLTNGSGEEIFVIDEE